MGVNRLDASANHSFEVERTRPPRVAEIRSGSHQPTDSVMKEAEMWKRRFGVARDICQDAIWNSNISW